MAAKRHFSLPARRNPLLGPDHTPQTEILVERRRLAQTVLDVKPGLVNTSNATRVENLGTFDYVHLRLPLPKDLTGSGIFTASGPAPIPEAYFLMRRSSDGYISATGMFKVAFPWAAKTEEEVERIHIKRLPSSDPQEVAGNVWVTPESALDLAEDYHITDWIVALLDNEEVEYAPGHKRDTIYITSPPAFTMAPKSSRLSPSIAQSSRKGRATSREVRSASPTKLPVAKEKSARPKKTPRKPRARKAIDETPEVADSADDIADDAEVDGEVDATGAEDDEEDEPLDPKNVRVSVHEEVKDDGETQTTHTTVKVEVPTSSPDLELPSNTEGVVEMAKEIIEKVKALQEGQVHAEASGSNASGKGSKGSNVPGQGSKGSNAAGQGSKGSNAAGQGSKGSNAPGQVNRGSTASAQDSKGSTVPDQGNKGSSAPVQGSKSKKRSRDTYEEDLIDGPEELVEEMLEAGTSERPAKRMRLMVPAEQYRREKVQKRALLGLSGALAFGLIIPTIASYWV